jgi:RNA polymerase sigma-70 factor (ECF subfamily)
MDPEQLVHSARAGSRSPAEALIERFYRPVYAFLCRLSGNPTDAADLTQRTFSKMWQALPSFASRASVSSWVHSIAYHVFVDWRRMDRHTEPRPTEWWTAQPSSSAGPDDVLANRDLAARLYSAVDALETTLRETVHLHYYQELTLEETADAMNVATSTVKYRLRLALKELQKQMEEPVLKQIPSL